MAIVRLEELESRLGRTTFMSQTLEEIPYGYHPFSYYVLGGIDLDGQALAMNGNATFDTPEEIGSGVAVDAACDCRVSGFDIAEASGIEAYERVRVDAEGKSGNHTSVSDVVSSATESSD